MFTSGEAKKLVDSDDLLAASALTFELASRTPAVGTSKSISIVSGAFAWTGAMGNADAKPATAPHETIAARKYMIENTTPANQKAIAPECYKKSNNRIARTTDAVQ